MNPQSTLQQQFPLHRKKFYKKMFSFCVSSLVFSGMFSGFVTVAYLAITLPTGQHGIESPQIIKGVSIFLATTTFFFFLFTIPYGLYVRAYIRRYYYSGEDKYITIKKGVFTPAEIHVQYQKIQDVYVDQDIIDRILVLSQP